MIEGDKECEVNVIEEVATKNDIELEVAMEESTVDDHVETFLIPNLETWVVASGNQRETQERDGGGEEEKDQDNIDNDIDLKMARASNDHAEDSSTLVPETSAFASKSQ